MNNLRLLLIGFYAGFCGLSLYSQERYTNEVESKVELILSQMTLDEKLSYLGGHKMCIKALERFGVPAVEMRDGPQGLGTGGKSTAYPSTILLASTWNEKLAYKYGRGLGRDAKARGVRVLLGPGVNIYRSPLCGRNYEYMGEDPFLAGTIASSYIRGVQDEGVIATVKHFMANNSDYDRSNISNDIDERTLHEIYFPAFKMAVQQGGVGAVMTSYNLMNGIYTTENPWLTKEILRKQWGFKGFVMTDWGAAQHTIPCVKSGLDIEMPSAAHFNLKELKYYLRTGDITLDMIDEKVRNLLRSVLAFGLVDIPHQDLSIPLDDSTSVETALETANEGLVLLKNEKKILPIDTRKVKNIVVTGKNAKGYIYGWGSGAVYPIHYVDLLEGLTKAAVKHHVAVEYVDEYTVMSPILFTSSDRSEKGLRAEYFDNPVLTGTPCGKRTEDYIKYTWNEGPGVEGIGKENFSVRWTGVMVPDVTTDYQFKLGGDDGYRLFVGDELLINNWTGGAYRVVTASKRLEVGKEYPIRVEYFQKGGDASIDFVWTRKNANGVDPFIDKLNKADLVVTCFGYSSDREGEAHDRDFELPDYEWQHLSKVLQTSTPIVGVVTGGGNIEMQRWEPKMKGLLWAWYAGQEAGTAIANVLFGDVNPSGKLPVTFEKRWEDNPTYSSYHDSDGDKHVEYTEGIFVGYRGYDKLQRDVQYPFGFGMSYTTFSLLGMKNHILEDGSVEISFILKNTGGRAGAQVVQLYVNKGNKYVENPLKELKGFKKLYLKPGESTTGRIRLERNAFSWYDVEQKQFVTKPDQYEVMLGFSSRDIRLKELVTLP